MPLILLKQHSKIPIKEKSLSFLRILNPIKPNIKTAKQLSPLCPQRCVSQHLPLVFYTCIIRRNAAVHLQIVVLGVCLVSRTKSLALNTFVLPGVCTSHTWARMRWNHSLGLLHILSQWSHFPLQHNGCDFIFTSPSSLLPAGCQRPEAYLTALLAALQATGLSDCCNMLHISPGTHSEYNRRQVPHPSLAKPPPRSLLLRWNERCAICQGVWFHTRPGK